MKEYTGTGKLRLFLLVGALNLPFCGSMEAFAESVNVRISENADDGKMTWQIAGSRLFEKAFIPGESETAKLSVCNSSGKIVSGDIKFAKKAGKELYEALELKAEDESGVCLYNGSLKNASIHINAQNKNKTITYFLQLSLPKTAGKSTAGQKAEFDIVLKLKEDSAEKTNSDSKDKENGTNKENKTENARGGSGGNAGNSIGGNGSSSGGGIGGTGIKGYDNSKTPGSKNDGSNVSEEGGIITGSTFDRTFIKKYGELNKDSKKSGDSILSDKSSSGFFGNKNAVGGGIKKTYDSPDINVKEGMNTGRWKKNKDGFWRYITENEERICGGFAFIMNPYCDSGNDAYRWYYFDEDGRLIIGWIRAENDVWYHSHEESDGDLGAIECGWLASSQDNSIYYLSETDAKMRSGRIGFRNTIYDKVTYYHFASLSDTYRQNWFFNTGVGRWLYDMLGYRSYGSLYINADAPDGCRVGADGICTKK